MIDATTIVQVIIKKNKTKIIKNSDYKELSNKKISIIFDIE